MLSHIILGIRDEVALIFSGIHGSELSGIEVANWVRVKLEKRSVPPLFTTILIPEVFPDKAKIARDARIKKNFAKEEEDCRCPKEDWTC